MPLGPAEPMASIPVQGPDIRRPTRSYPSLLYLADVLGRMLELVGIAWSAWKLSVKRLGPWGAAVVALLAVVGFALLRNYLEDEHPELAEGLEQAV